MATPQEVLTPPGDRARRLPGSRASESEPSPRSNRRTTTSCLRLALQRTSRPPSGRPLAAPESDLWLLPSDSTTTAFLTPDIIDLQGSNQVSGRNRPGAQ